MPIRRQQLQNGGNGGQDAAVAEGSRNATLVHGQNQLKRARWKEQSLVRDGSRERLCKLQAAMLHEPQLWPYVLVGGQHVRRRNGVRALFPRRLFGTPSQQ